METRSTTDGKSVLLLLEKCFPVFFTMSFFSHGKSEVFHTILFFFKGFWPVTHALP